MMRYVPKQFEIWFALVIAAVVLASMSIYFRGPGIPLNHEGLSYLQRIAVHADHFRQGDLFPIWASSDAFGLGTSQPLFYHKTFYYMSGWIYLLTGSIKFAAAATIAIWLVIGAYGMRLAASKLTDSRVLQTAAAVTFLWSSYTFTDWLVRGAMAEFTAMMCIPWLLWWCLTLIRDKRFPWTIVPIMFLMVQSHNVTALFGALAALTAAAIFLWQERLEGLLAVWKRALIGVLALGVLLVPQLLLQKISLADYNPGKITQSGFLASENFKPAQQYVWDRGYTWLEDWRDMTVQVDVGIWLAIGICVLIIGFQLSRHSNTVRKNLQTQLPAIVFLITGLAIFTLLQLTISKPLYELVAPMQFLQFPWRLLAYLTPLGILLIVAGMAVAIKRERWLAAICAVWVALFIAFSPLVHRYQHAFIPPASIDAMIDGRDPKIINGVLTGIGEYYPRVFDDQGKELQTLQTVQLYQKLYDEKKLLQVIDGYCEVRAASSADRLELLSKRFTYTCDSTSVVALPVSYSRLTYVTDTRTGEKVPRFRQATDPRLQVSLKPGSGSIEVHLPSLLTASKLVLHKL